MSAFQQQRSDANNMNNNNNYTLPMSRYSTMMRDGEDSVMKGENADIDTNLGSSSRAMVTSSNDTATTNNLSKTEMKKLKREADEEAIAAMFSGDELMGKCIDVHQHYEIFINANFSNSSSSSTGGKGSNVPISYREYVSTCFGSVEGMKGCVSIEKKLRGGIGGGGAGPRSTSTNNTSGGGGGGGDVGNLILDSAVRPISTSTSLSLSTSSANVTYADYLQSVEAYLVSFIDRTYPLMDIQSKLKKSADDCRRAWQNGSVHGWESLLAPNNTDNNNMKDNINVPIKSPINLDAFSTSEELLSSVGVESITSALKDIGLKAGGSPAQRSDRLFSIRGVTDASRLDPKIFASGAFSKHKKKFAHTADMVKRDNTGNNNTNNTDAKTEERRQRKLKVGMQIAILEAKVATMLDMNEVKAAVNSTLTNIERKQALTFEEMQAEALAAELEEDVELVDSDDEDAIYNPLKLPLDWDGKPIPYWLYKLHGLNQEFRCEICGNTSYYGRRAFERHFNEQKHQAGLRALGIPPGKEFHEITEIQDALDLYQSMVAKGLVSKKGALTNNKTTTTNVKWDAADDEEFEDDEGNVYNRKTYEDLKRQGLI